MKNTQTDVTKKYKKIYLCCSITSWIITLVPLIVYVVKAFIEGSIVNKLSLGLMLTSAIILTLINLVAKMHLKTPIWMLVIGIYFCLDNIMPLLVILVLSTMIDELILTPMAKNYKNKFIINKEIDQRGQI